MIGPPVNVGQETEHGLDVLHLPEHLGTDDGVGLEHLEDEDRGPAEDEDGDHHDQHRDDGLHVRLGPIRAEAKNKTFNFLKELF